MRVVEDGRRVRVAEDVCCDGQMIDVLLFVASIASAIALVLYSETRWPVAEGSWRWVPPRPVGVVAQFVVVMLSFVIYLAMVVAIAGWLGPSALLVGFLIIAATAICTRWLFRSFVTPRRWSE
jgi:hypothetical protein